MSATTFEVKLTPGELLLLDGQCRGEVQKKVDMARATLVAVESGASEAVGKLIAEIVEEALAKGRLIYGPRRIKYCGCCKTSGGYAPYKSGRNHGRPNYKRPLFLAGWEFADAFVQIEGYASVGACSVCVTQAMPLIIETLADIQVEIPNELMTADRVNWIRCFKATCKKCEWIGHEGQLGWLRTLMGESYYRGKCPGCGACNEFMTTVIERDSEYVIVSIDELKPAPNGWQVAR